MAESIHEQIAAALRAGLAAIVSDEGLTYWYTPRLVDRVSFYPDDLDPSFPDGVYLLRAGEEEHSEETTGDPVSGVGMLAFAEFFLLLARRFEPSSEKPGQQPNPSRATVVNRMVRDALRYLLADIQLSGLAENVVNDSLFVNRDMPAPKWALAELRFVVRYSYLSMTP